MTPGFSRRVRKNLWKLTATYAEGRQYFPLEQSVNLNSRQSFLGSHFPQIAENAFIGVVGLGGGGSHVIQQLAHIGFLNPIGFDSDTVDKEGTNLNRLISGNWEDAVNEVKKVDVARRPYTNLHPNETPQFFETRWQDNTAALKQCHVVIGCVDSYSQRAELEKFCRRFQIAYIDIGMDVFGDAPPVIGGQIILSLPGGPCMRCLEFITEERLAEEGARYGNAGGRPQVVWPNGVLASTAVGLCVDLLSDWTKRGERTFEYLVYDGNRMTVQPHLRHEEFSTSVCNHYDLSKVGTPLPIWL